MPYCDVCMKEVEKPVKVATGGRVENYCWQCYRANVPVRYSDVKMKRVS